MKKSVTINGNVVEWHEGMTVTKAMEIMNYSYKLIVVYINDDYVPQDEWNTTLIPEGADVKIVHIMSGG